MLAFSCWYSNCSCAIWIAWSWAVMAVLQIGGLRLLRGGIVRFARQPGLQTADLLYGRRAGDLADDGGQALDALLERLQILVRVGLQGRDRVDRLPDRVERKLASVGSVPMVFCARYWEPKGRLAADEVPPMNPGSEALAIGAGFADQWC